MSSEQLAPAVDNFLGKTATVKKLDIQPNRDISSDLLFLSEQVAHISGTWNPVEIYTADGAKREEEKKKFLDAFDRGEEYNPTFEYSYANSLDLANSREYLLQRLSGVRTFKPQNRGERLYRAALYFKIKDDVATCDLVDGIKTKDDKKIAAAVRQKYLGTDKSLMDLAEAIYKEKTNSGETDEAEGNGLLTEDEKKYLREREFKAQDIKDAFEFVLDRYGILRSESNNRGFKVKIDDNASGIDVRDKSAEQQTVFIPTDRKMNGITLLGAIAHEIEGHAIQAMNGIDLYVGLGGGPLKIDDEQLYEGYGIKREADMKKKLLGANDPGPRPYYPFAVKMAEDGASFYDIFKDQLERHLRVSLKKPKDEDLPSYQNIDQKNLNTARSNAWLVAYRVMRGHIDTSNAEKYAMAKDLGYVRGFQMDTQLAENGYGYVNESGIIAPKALQLIAELNISEEMLPLPFVDATTAYWEEILKPQMTQEDTIP
ncbi:MAG TPA: hypothetical protein VG965_01855 [Patescibacteria group bacterium]|nr:hypothetical protein [Patescibacteria group bacterium]